MRACDFSRGSLKYYALHSTPSLAVRTVLFFEGYPTVAFSGEVKEERDVKKEWFFYKAELGCY
ncbi:hypothetical protein AB2553_21460 [Bacillus mycoides]|uniref:hypothetical protein n=1 Tax=Bacillus mycoides TaxID=1405 RepID=UPI0034638D29